MISDTKQKIAHEIRNSLYNPKVSQSTIKLIYSFYFTLNCKMYKVTSTKAIFVDKCYTLQI